MAIYSWYTHMMIFHSELLNFQRVEDHGVHFPKSLDQSMLVRRAICIACLISRGQKSGRTPKHHLKMVVYPIVFFGFHSSSRCCFQCKSDWVCHKKPPTGLVTSPYSNNRPYFYNICRSYPVVILLVISTIC